MAQVFIGFGSNLGDKFRNLILAISMIDTDLGQVSVRSSFYESEPWGFDSTELFINGVLELHTIFSPEDLLIGLKKIERNIGRQETTTEVYIDRLIDLDILYYGETLINIHGLEIPHPRIYDRRFVLEPMVEIAPNFIDIKVGKSMQELLNTCSDESILKKILN
jgi:2-amino-4-hydroxy-6-hydroxymethyldihydropteridine diphosphokinase